MKLSIVNIFLNFLIEKRTVGDHAMKRLVEVPLADD